ncbi:ATP-binding cassette domain-containing protein [Deinococcus cellulosilyticus]|uniref:ABC transporter domain-containing protein n=1 Tax=Deinococcus cellulosilyticus (strain DSM 18568 / NBRC 106333 / KACC 11606 / 5516J-15) TaxID=1223518 RepID=A0A511N1Y9_DEIC1|nr:ATP-binding cassette domain-containing protein [Deinococcus cellulosilyticus]GEM46870.1 hypothetical protein DC3_25050 [Deinococcus cellulosilyticus NBRC 106333 = KACC 11606]
MNPETHPDLPIVPPADPFRRPVLETQALCVEVEGLDLIQNLDLCVLAGESVAVVGPSGSGKTVLLQVLMGTRTAHSGKVRVLDAIPADMAYCARVGWIQQHAKLADNLSVRELMELFGSFAPQTLPVETVLEWTGLQDHADTPYGRLTPLQQQLTHLASVVGSCPELLVLDAPTGHLTLEEQEVFWLHLQQVLTPEQTLIFTTRSQVEAEKYAHRTVQLG